MPALCDVNVLLALCYERHEHHPAALQWFERQDFQSLIVCRNSQLGLLRLLCNETVMGADVCSLDAAWQVYDAMLCDERFAFYHESEGLDEYLRSYSASGRASPKLWQDAYLTAFARSAHIGLATFDRGFEKFDSVRLLLLPHDQ
jgi:toxin-antitoxin system PIN domain toxin